MSIDVSAIPYWVYFVGLAVTFMFAHVIGFKPSANPRGNLPLRIGSSLLLLVALLIVDPEQPARALIALPIAAAAGFVSGRSAPALKPRAPAEDEKQG